MERKEEYNPQGVENVKSSMVNSENRIRRMTVNIFKKTTRFKKCKKYFIQRRF
jgi:hypothetical protein